jgi:DNA-directed RNA polymerase subunit K/omega
VPKVTDINTLMEMQGGPFRLTAIVQKRMRELVKGARPLVDAPKGRKDLLDMVLRELSEGRIEATEDARETPAEQLFKPVMDDDDSPSPE